MGIVTAAGASLLALDQMALATLDTNVSGAATEIGNQIQTIIGLAVPVGIGVFIVIIAIRVLKRVVGGSVGR